MPAKSSSKETKALNCPKCGAGMEEGVILELGHLNAAMTEKWVEGQPKSSWWGGVKTTGKRTREVATWRCAACGFLESYAK